MPKYSPRAVANYFISKASEVGESLTAMKLLKLVYLAHAWHLALKKEPLLNEPVEAWRYGPVISSLYHALKVYGSGAVSKRMSSVFPDADPAENAETSRLLDTVFTAYGKANALQLSTWTHQEGTPWWKAWHELEGKKRKNAVIPDSLILAHFARKHADYNATPGL